MNILITLAFLIVFTPSQKQATQITCVQKKEFIQLLKTLPTKGEFFTDEAVKQAYPYLPVLFALTEKDIENYDIYPFGAISRGMADDEKNRQYAVSHFAEINHPTLKLFWAAMLFNSEDRSVEIARFLKEAFTSETQTKWLRELVGPNFEDFKSRVMAFPVPK